MINLIEILGFGWIFFIMYVLLGLVLLSTCLAEPNYDNEILKKYWLILFLLSPIWCVMIGISLFKE